MSEVITRVDLGCGTVKPVGYVGIDKFKFPEVDQVMDLDKQNLRLPYKDNEVYEIRAYHFLEHIYNLFPLMNECWRVLRGDGAFDIAVPMAPSRTAFDDPSHVRFFTRATFHYFTDKPPGNYVNPEIKGFWKILKNDWTPLTEETGDSVIYTDSREMHVILQPIKPDFKP